MAKILIVDDEKSIRLTLQAFLKDEGYEVEVAEDVEHAQDLLQRQTFDVVVSDIIMPRVTGVTLLQQIKETAPEVQVVMMTGEPTVETAAEAVRAGACDYLTKPVGKPAILKAVANATTIKGLEDDKRLLEDANQQHRENLEELVEQRTHELQEALERVEKAQDQLIQHERMSALGQMASGIAHDFNNVLMPIRGFSELLLSDPKALDDRDEANHMLEMIRSASDDATHIVRRLREIYRPDDTDYGSVDLARVLESVASLTTPKWKEEMNAKGVNIDMVTEFQPVPMIKGNASELREAFTNLLFNAVDAMPDGGTITLLLRPADEPGVLLEVSDTGLGMDSETSRHCVEPFFTTKGLQGTGLGLPMVYGIMQRHDGTVEIDSTPGQGTTIRMRFPLPIEIQVADDGPAKKDPEPFPPLRVLVIDDEARSRNLVARFLKDGGHVVETAEGGQQGLQMFRQGEFELVITDRAMPFISGDEVAAEIAKDRPATPLIMLTGFGDIMKDKGECPTGVTRVMAKPVTRPELMNVIAEVMRQNANAEEHNEEH